MTVKARRRAEVERKEDKAAAGKGMGISLICIKMEMRPSRVRCVKN